MDTEQQRAFVRELKALLKKYNVNFEKEVDYDGNDDACGNKVNLIGPGIEIRDIDEDTFS